MTNFEESLAAEAERLERKYADHDIEAFTRRLAQRIADKGATASSEPPPIREIRIEPPAPRRPQTVRPSRGAFRRRLRRRRAILRTVLPASRLPGRPATSTAMVDQLTRLCDDVLRSDQIATLADFAEHYDDAGARTFACLLYALDRTDSALYWWGFAAGAGDELAAHCLAVHHAALGTPTDARVWRTFARLIGFNPADHLPHPVRSGTEPARNLAANVTHNSELELFLAAPDGLPQELALR